MAKASNNLIFRTTDCQVLYHRQDSASEGYRVPEHGHPFWQLEIVKKGSIQFRIGSKNFSASQGSWMLIPPNTRHSLHYRKDTKYLSVKFSSGNQALQKIAGLWGNTARLNVLELLLSQLVPMGEQVAIGDG